MSEDLHLGDHREDDFQAKNLGSELGKRYAKAFFALSLDHNAVEMFFQDLGKIKEKLSLSPKLCDLLSSPRIASEQKLGALKAVISEDKCDEMTLNLLSVIAKNNRLAQLSEIIYEYSLLYDDHKGIIRAEVTSAKALSEQQLVRLNESLAGLYGKPAKISLRLDPTLLGGLKVRVGSKLFDASLRSRLDRLKFALKRA